jgi:hypothetical protein
LFEDDVLTFAVSFKPLNKDLGLYLFSGTGDLELLSVYFEEDVA